MNLQKANISLFDESFNKKQTDSYQLYLQIGYNTIRYLVFDKSKNTYIGFEEYIFKDSLSINQLNEAFNTLYSNSSILQLTFNKTIIAIENSLSTLIPNAIFKEEELSNYFKFNFSKVENCTYQFDELIGIDAKNIYAVNEQLIANITKLSNPKTIHFSSIIIESALSFAKKSKALSLIDVHVLPHSFQIAIVNQQKLSFYNSFSYYSSEDFIYYLLFVLEQHNINNTEATIRLLGEVEKNSALYSILKKYIKTINLGSKTSQVKYSYVFEDLPEHFHYTLFNMFLCE